MKFSNDPLGYRAIYCLKCFWTSSFDMPRFTMLSMVSASITILLSFDALVFWFFCLAPVVW